MGKKAFTAEGTISVGPYSHAKTGKIVNGDIAAQTEQCFRNVSNVLRAAGLSLDNVVKVTVFLTNMDDFSAMNSVYEKNFQAPFPARTTVGVAQLPLGARIEIEVMAHRD